MKKTYTRKQIQEAIKYWSKKLNAMNESMINNIYPNRYYIVDFQEFPTNSEQQRLRAGEIRYSDAETEKEIIVSEGPFNTLHDANAKLFELGLDIQLGYETYDDYVEDNMASFDDFKEYEMEMTYDNHDSNPADRVKGVQRVMIGRDIQKINFRK